MEQKEQELMIFLAGELRNLDNVSRLIQSKSFDFYAADGGYRIARELNVPLKRIFGDFDSIEPPRLPNLEIYPCEKDQTDSEIALDLAMEDGYRSLWMIAPFGGRIDHTMANLFLLEKAAHFDLNLRLYDGENLAFLLNEGEHILEGNYRYISFIPSDRTALVSISGVKYPLNQAMLRRDQSLGISNEAVCDNPKIQIHQGSIYCICIEQEAK